MAQQFQSKKIYFTKKFMILAEEFDCIAFLPYTVKHRFSSHFYCILKSFLLMFFCNDVSVSEKLFV